MAPRPRRILLRSAAGLGIAAAVLVLAALLALWIRPAREALLGLGLRRADAALPGRLAVERADWASPGRLELSDVVWTAAGDTLLAARRLAVDLDLPALLRRDLHLRRLEAAGLRVDLPAMARWRSGAAGAPAGDGAGVPWLRAGALPVLPSLAVDTLRASAPRVQLTDSLALAGLVLDASAELRAGRAPRARVRDLRLAAGPAGARVDSARVLLDLASGVAAGQASGVAPRVGSWRLALTEPAPDSLALTLRLRDVAAAPGGRSSPPALAARARLDRDGAGAVRRVDWVASLAAPDAASSDEPPDGRRLPPLRGRLAEAAGSIRLAPDPGGDATLRIIPQSWLEGGGLAATWDHGRLRLDSLRLAASGVSLAGRGLLGPDSLRADLTLAVGGPDLLALLAPAAEAPGSLSATGRLRLAGPRAAPSLSAHLRGRTTWPLPVDSLELAVACPALGPQPLRANLALGVAGLVLDTSAALEPGDTLSLAVDPLRLRRAGAPAAAAIGPPGRLRWHRRTGAFSATDLRLTGAVGDWEFAGSGDRAGARFAARGRWPEPPAALAAWLPAGAEDLAALAGGWDPGCEFAMEGAVAPRDGASAVTADARLHLPGPGVLAPLLPAGIEVADLGPLLGTVAATARVGRDRSLNVAADLGATAWLDTARAVLSGRGASLHLDTLALAGLGLRLAAAGRVDEAARDVRGRLTLNGLAPARRFLPDLDPAWRGRLDTRFAVAGTNAAPRVRADLSGEAAGPGLSLPALEGRLRWTADSLAARLAAPAGAAAGALSLDSLRLDYAAGAAPLPGRLTLFLAGTDLAWHQGLTLSHDAAWELRSDSLSLALRGRTLASRTPFRVVVDPAAGAWRVEDMALRGSLGSLVARGGFSGPAAPGSAADLSLRLDLAPPPSLRPPALHPGWWPARAVAEVDLPAADSLRATLRLEGLEPVRDLDAEARLEMVQGPGGLRGALSLNANGAVLCGADLAAPALLALPGARPAGGGSFTLDLRFGDLPLPLLTPASRGLLAPDDAFHLAGGLQAGGDLGAPAVRADLALGFPARGGLDRYRLTVEARQEAPVGLRAAVVLLREEERRLRGELALPLAASLRPARAAVPAADSLYLTVASEDLRLRDLSPLLPAHLGVDGTCRLSLAARGPAGDPALAGTVALRNLRVQMAGGSHLSLDGTLNAAGRVRRPSVAGDLAVKSGVLRLASVERRLHPVDPPSRLRDAGFGAIDTAAPAPPRALAPDSLALDVTLDIPGGLWLKGPGLEVELTGALQVDQSGGLPRLTGSLEARRGTLELLGRRFRMERGRVHFYGGDDLDPALDLDLTTQLEGVLVHVAMGGTARAPKLELSSEPPMSEGDIMAFLVFGRRLDELDDDQVTLLQERGAEAATSLGVTTLEDRLSRQIGLDMLTFRRGGEEGGRAVTVGKYLSPRVLLTYQQSLEEAGAFVLNFEYFLPKRLRLETTLGQRSPSGVAFNWARDF